MIPTEFLLKLPALPPPAPLSSSVRREEDWAEAATGADRGKERNMWDEKRQAGGVAPDPQKQPASHCLTSWEYTTKCCPIPPPSFTLSIARFPLFFLAPGADLPCYISGNHRTLYYKNVSNHKRVWSANVVLGKYRPSQKYPCSKDSITGTNNLRKYLRLQLETNWKGQGKRKGWMGWDMVDNRSNKYIWIRKQGSLVL